MRFSLLPTAALVFGLASPALAQQAGDDEIVVTAQLRSQNLQEVPIAISALSADDIERVNASDLKELQFFVPNFVIAGIDPSRYSIGFRGIVDNSRNPGYDNRVGVYVDGVWIGRQALNQGTLDVAGVEVLRGPQGTLFGKNTVAGAISITTREAADQFGARLTLESGNYGLAHVVASVDAPISESIRTRLALSTTDRDGFVEDVLRDQDYDDLHSRAFRAQADVDLGPATGARFSVDFDENDFNNTGSERLSAPYAFGPYEVALDLTPRTYIRGQGASLNVTHAFDNGFELTSITGFRASSRRVMNIDEDYSPSNLVYDDRIAEDAENFSQEFRIASPENERFDYVAGLYYLSQDIEGGASAVALLSALNPALPAVFRDVRHEEAITSSSWAAFVHGNYRFTDSLQVTAGLRYTSEDKDIDYTLVDNTSASGAPGAGGLLFTDGSLVDSRSASDVSPRISLNWFASDHIMTYVSYSRGFKSGGWNADYVNNVAAQLPFEDEQVDAYELGLRSEFHDGRVRFNANLFRQQHTDFQVFSFVQLSTGGTRLSVTNAGEATTEGVEIEANWFATERLRFWGNYAHTEATFDSFKDGGGIGVDFDGNQLAFSPENSYSLSGEYRAPVAGGELVTQLDYVYRDDYFSNPDNLAINHNESLGLLNGRVGFEAERWSIYLWGKNLTDETVQVINSRSFLGIPRATYNDPATYGVALNVRFAKSGN